ncbi:MAG: 50S ribosomal protein L6 [Bacilli bacterium]|nr:50S ribosomal protein L6 [Bacilli bacterium]
MSRIGFKIIKIPSTVTLDIRPEKVKVMGPRGTLDVRLIPGITCEFKDGILSVKRINDEQVNKTNHGTVRANLNNAVIGVTDGYKKALEIRGIGYRANMQGEKLCLHIGYSHTVIITPEPNSKITCKDATNIIVEGIDKQAVGQTAALIHDARAPEVYKGKGIRYVGEYVPHKEGKRATAAGGPAAGGAK